MHVTHNQEEAMMLGDRICLMQNGSIMQVGTGNDIFKKPESDFAANFFGACNIYNGISKIKDGVSIIEIDGCRIRSTVLKEGHITCSIRPEDTVISTNHCNPDANNFSTGNFFKGKIEKIVNRGVIVQVYIDASIPIINYTLGKSFNQMDIKAGDKVNVGFEENDVHIV
ncbi:MAG: TOBE domain-containing protein [Desulfosarcina sp.]|nr:TOBE domain-containing protein [Desulfobacterales bacterium]